MSRYLVARPIRAICCNSNKQLHINAMSRLSSFFRIPCFMITICFLPQMALIPMTAGEAVATIDAEYDLPSSDHARMGNIVSGPDGNLWVVGASGWLHKIDPHGIVEKYPIPINGFRIAVCSNGLLWITDPVGGHIVTVNFNGQVIQNSVTPQPCLPYEIVCGEDGAMYFSDKADGIICRSSSPSSVTKFVIPKQINPLSPDYLCVGSDKNIWFVEQNNHLLGRLVIHTNPPVMELYHIPWTTSPIGALQTGPDGRLWFTLPSLNLIAKFDILTAGFSSVAVPANFVNIYRWVVADDENLWGVNHQPLQFSELLFAPEALYKQVSIGGIGESVALGPDGNVWVLESGNGTTNGRVGIERIVRRTPPLVSVGPAVIKGSLNSDYKPICLCTPEAVSRNFENLQELDRRNLVSAMWWDSSSARYRRIGSLRSGDVNSFSVGIMISSTIDQNLLLDGLASRSPFPIQLLPGWNYIGVPPVFEHGITHTVHSLGDFNISSQNYVSLTGAARTSAVGHVAYYWNGSSYDPVTTLESGKAYWIKNNTTETLTLTRVNTATGGVVFSSDREIGTGPDASTSTGGGGTGDDQGGLDLPPLPKFAELAQSDSHACGTGTTAGLIIAAMSLIGFRLRRRAA